MRLEKWLMISSTVCYSLISVKIVTHISQDQVQYINQVLQVKIAYHNHNHNFITFTESITFGHLISISFQLSASWGSSPQRWMLQVGHPVTTSLWIFNAWHPLHHPGEETQLTRLFSTNIGAKDSRTHTLFLEVKFPIMARQSSITKSRWVQRIFGLSSMMPLCIQGRRSLDSSPKWTRECISSTSCLGDHWHTSSSVDHEDLHLSWTGYSLLWP